MSLLDITPVAPRNPFAPGALLPMTVETKNSTYAITEHALRVDSPATCTVSCTKGTFEGQSWVVYVADVFLTRAFFAVEGSVGLCSTKPVAVNGYPVSTWDIPALYGTCEKCHATCTRVFLASRDSEAGYCAECIANGL